MGWKVIWPGVKSGYTSPSFGIGTAPHTRPHDSGMDYRDWIRGRHTTAARPEGSRGVDAAVASMPRYAAGIVTAVKPGSSRTPHWTRVLWPQPVPPGCTSSGGSGCGRTSAPPAS